MLSVATVVAIGVGARARKGRGSSIQGREPSSSFEFLVILLSRQNRYTEARTPATATTAKPARAPNTPAGTVDNDEVPHDAEEDKSCRKLSPRTIRDV